MNISVFGEWIHYQCPNVQLQWWNSNAKLKKCKHCRHFSNCTNEFKNRINSLNLIDRNANVFSDSFHFIKYFVNNNLREWGYFHRFNSISMKYFFFCTEKRIEFNQMNLRNSTNYNFYFPSHFNTNGVRSITFHYEN